MRALYFQTDKETCMLNNSLRKIDTPEHSHMSKSVSKVVIHTYFKNHVAPALNEGFSEVIEIPYVEDTGIDRELLNKLS